MIKQEERERRLDKGRQGEGKKGGKGRRKGEERRGGREGGIYARQVENDPDYKGKGPFSSQGQVCKCTLLPEHRRKHCNHPTNGPAFSRCPATEVCILKNIQNVSH